MRVFRPLICIFVFLKCVNYFAEFGACSDSGSRPANESSTHQPSDGSDPNQRASSTTSPDSKAPDPSRDPNSQQAPASQNNSSTKPNEAANSSADSNSPGIKETNDKGLELFFEGSKTPNDTSKCEKKELGSNRIDYEIKDNGKCVKVVINGAEIWKHGDHGWTEDPKTVSLTNGNKLTIYFVDEDIDYKKDKEGNWKYLWASMGILKKQSGDKTGGFNGNRDANGTSGGGGTGTQASSGGPISGGQGGGTGTGSGEATDPNGTTPDPTRTSGGGHTGSESSGRPGHTGPTSGSQPAGRGTGQTVNQTSGGSQPAKPAGQQGSSAGAPGGPNLTSNPGPTASTNPSASSGPSNTSGIALDIKKNKKDNPKFSHEKKGKVVTYTAKGDNKFSSVIHNDKTTIWSGDNPNNYATKVVLDGRGKKEKKVTIHLANGSKKVYNRPGKDKAWTEVTGTNPNNGSNGTAAVH